MAQSAHDRRAHRLATNSFNMQRGPALVIDIEGHRKALLKALEGANKPTIAAVLTGYIDAVKQFPRFGRPSSLIGEIHLNVGQMLLMSRTPEEILETVDKKLCF